MSSSLSKKELSSFRSKLSATSHTNSANLCQSPLVRPIKITMHHCDRKRTCALLVACLIGCFWMFPLLVVVSGAEMSTPNANQTLVVGKTSSTVNNSNKTSGTLEHQATDMSSMYVQIPIAEPVESSAASSQQQQHDASSTPAKSAQVGSTWTGPWPKKFQIGYIKQSDLHQVLLESLKGDSFLDTTSKTAQAPGATSSGATKTSANKSSNVVAPPSDAASLMADYQPVSNSGNNMHQHAQAGVFQRAPMVQRVPRVPMKSLYGLGAGAQATHMGQQQQQQNAQLRGARSHHARPSVHSAPFRQPYAAAPAFGQQHEQVPMFHHNNNHHHQMQLQLKQDARLGAPPSLHQQAPKIVPMSAGYLQQQQQQQLQFASGQFSSFKNQPIYTMNFAQQQQQQQPIEEQVQLMQLGGQRPQAQKSDYYSSSWRPVTNSDETKGGSLSDGFDDEFGANGAMNSLNQPANKETNRHPVLSSFMGDEQQQQQQVQIQEERPAKVWPAKAVKSGAKSASASKTDSANQAKAASKGAESGDRRAAGSAPTTTTTTSTTSAPPTVSQTAEEPASNASVGADSATTMTTPTTTLATSTAGPGIVAETTEPESEVVESSTSSDEQQDLPESPGTTTTANSATTTTSTTQQSSSSAPAPSSSTASSMAAGGDQASGSTSAPSSEQEAGTTQESTREETTPNDGGPVSLSATSTASTTSATELEGQANSTADSSSSGAKLLAGTDASLSDEQLLAAAVRASGNLNKAGQSGQARSQRLQRPAVAGSTKKARSSEQKLAPSARKSSPAPATKSSNKLVTKRPQSPGRAGKQASTTSGAKSSKSVGAEKSPTNGVSRRQAASGKQKQRAAPKTTRMAPTAERLQAPPRQQQPQMVSMSAAQAQSTAQTLAALLLSRCLSSSNCAHLLDVCSTKQAAVSLADGEQQQQQPSASSAAATTTTTSTTNSTNSIGSAWSVPVGLMSSNLMSLMSSLQADKALRLFPQWRDTIENIVDQDASTGYTLVMPSNDAIDRMAAAQIDALLEQPSDQLSQLIESHILDTAETIELVGQNQQQQQANLTNRSSRATNVAQSGLVRGERSRYLRSSKGQSMQVNQHRDRMVTINGKRVVYANQLGPANGRIHVIDGLLQADWPAVVQAGAAQLQQQQRALDIMETLKQCDKFDGFVTLAEGTGLTSILKQDGPLTVFVPSNEALRKIPDEELEVIKNNSTALREFLMYHIVNGSYFSQDLRDGQQLASILDMRPIQVGVRVDGCSRRLVEANTSPMRRPDIVAKNGVIHILDWYLTVRDNDWCDPIALRNANNQVASSSTTQTTTTTTSTSTAASSSPGSAPAVASKRLLELASEQNHHHDNLPPNHKAATPIRDATQNHNSDPSAASVELNYHTATGDMINYALPSTKKA